MSTRGQRINPITAGIIAGLVMIAIVGLFASININFSAPWQSTHTVIVQTTDADGITVSSDVRIHGRLVGQVTGIKATGQNADVTLHLDNAEWPLPANTKASVRLATLLGQKYIELEPPTGADAKGQLQDDATIKNANPVVDFDQILSTFDPKTRESLKNILATGGRAVANQEGTIQNLVPDLALLNTLSQAPTAELANRDADLNSILQNLAVTASQLAASRDDLAGVLDNANRLTGALAQNTGTLRSFIKDGDQTLQLTDQVLGNGYAPKLANDLLHLNPVVHDLKSLLDIIYPQTLMARNCCIPATHSLIYEITDAHSQSDRNGYFLRQNVQSIDLSNILATESPTGSSTGTPPAPAHGAPVALPQIPPLPLPIPLPPVCVGSVCLPGTTPPGGTPPPKPAPVCILNICTGSYVDPAAPAATATLSSTQVDTVAQLLAWWGTA